MQFSVQSIKPIPQVRLTNVGATYISFFIKLLFSFIGVVVSRPDTSGWPGVFDGGDGGGGGFGPISSTKEPPDGEVWSPTRFTFSQQTLVSWDQTREHRMITAFFGVLINQGTLSQLLGGHWVYHPR